MFLSEFLAKVLVKIIKSSTLGVYEDYQSPSRYPHDISGIGIFLVAKRKSLYCVLSSMRLDI